MADKFSAQLDDTRSANFGHLLMKAARLTNETALARVNLAINGNFRPAHTQLFPHIDLSGTRQTVIAEKIGISKQAVGQLVRDLENMGTLERVPDPSDRRAQLVRFTQKGQLGLIAGLSVLAQLETDIAQKTSPELINRLKNDLASVLRALEEGL